jgi:hypothetical protein
MGKTKSKADAPEAKEKERRLPVKRMPSALRVGDHLVLTTDKMGYVGKSVAIRHLERGKCCLNYHINSGCYHRHVAVMVAVPEKEALGMEEFEDDIGPLGKLIDAAIAEAEALERKGNKKRRAHR